METKTDRQIEKQTKAIQKASEDIKNLAFALTKTMQVPVTVEVEDRMDTEDSICVILDQWIVLAVFWGEEDEVSVKGRIPTEKVMIEVCEVRTEHNYPSEPDIDYEEPIMQVSGVVNAVYEAMSLYWKHRINQALQSIEESKMEAISILDDLTI